MFEKEAEDSFNGKKVLYKSSTDKRSYIDGFKDGYNKANEWHDLRKNPQDLPDGEGTFLVAIKYPAGWCESFILEYTTDEDDEEKLGWWDSEYTNFDNEVCAWREIPKPPKGDDA